jgi:hypothetical protein
VHVNVSVSIFQIPKCSISNVLFLYMSMSVSVDCPCIIALSLTSCYCVCHCHTQEKDVRDRTMANGQSNDTDIDIHKKNTLEMIHNKKCLVLVYVNVNFSRLSIPDCHISNIFVMCMSMSIDCPFLIVISLRR